jgi:D-sedoheptulose 7-phosphate isomerase
VTFAPLSALLARVPDGDHRRAVMLCRDAKAKGKQFFFVGNGGSAAIASHMAADWFKAGGVKAQCFNEAALVTALSNDEGYSVAFSRPLERHGQRGDVLFAISSSGRSDSILNAAKTANMADMKVVTLSGFTPHNPLKGLGEVNFYVDSDRYGLVEVAHHAICHSILDAVIDAS